MSQAEHHQEGWDGTLDCLADYLGRITSTCSNPEHHLTVASRQPFFSNQSNAHATRVAASRRKLDGCVMIDGVWHAREPKSDGKDGAFKRPETSFRNWITADGSAGATGTDGFPAEPGRYHLLYLSRLPLGPSRHDLPGPQGGSKT